MKKGICGMVVSAVVVGFVSLIGAAETPFSITASTYPITEAATIAVQVSGTQKFKTLVVSNSGTTAQTITIYSKGGSTTTATAVATFVVPAAAGYYNPFGTSIDMEIQDMCVRKSTTATTVYISGSYK